MRASVWFPSGWARCSTIDAGWPSEKEHAAKLLTIGATYHVADEEIHASSSRILIDVDGFGAYRWWNTVFFVDAEPGAK